MEARLQNGTLRCHRGGVTDKAACYSFGVMADELPDLAFEIGDQGASLESWGLAQLAEFLRDLQRFIQLMAPPGKPLKASLVALGNDSADYAVTSPDPRWALAKHAIIAAANDGADSLTMESQEAFLKVYERASTIGTLSLRHYNYRKHQRGDHRIPVKPPALLSKAWLRYTTTLYGRIISIDERDTGQPGHVVIKQSSGKNVTISATAELVQEAHGLFDSLVIARMEAGHSQAGPVNRTLRSLEKWTPVDFMAAIESVRSDLESRGIDFDPDDLMGDLDD